jgi:hypothetical protein
VCDNVFKGVYDVGGQVLTLCNELLPAIPDSSDLLLADLPPLTTLAEMPAAGAAAAAGQGAPSLLAVAAQQAGRVEWLASHQDLLANYCHELLPVLLQVYSATVIPQVLRQVQRHCHPSGITPSTAPLSSLRRYYAKYCAIVIPQGLAKYCRYYAKYCACAALGTVPGLC